MPDTTTPETTLARAPEGDRPSDDRGAVLSQHAAAAAEAAYILEAIRK